MPVGPQEGLNINEANVTQQGLNTIAAQGGAAEGDSLAVGADGHVAFASGGSSAILKSTPRTLTNDEILALPGTDVELIPAPGSSKMIVPLAAFLLADFTVAYSGVDADTEYPAMWVAHKTSPIYLNEFIDNPDTPGIEVGQTGLTNFLTTTNTFGVGLYTLLPQRESLVPVGSTLAHTDNQIGGGGVTADYEDVSLKIGADNSGNFTGGDAANTLTVTVLYTVLDV